MLTRSMKAFTALDGPSNGNRRPLKHGPDGDVDRMVSGYISTIQDRNSRLFLIVWESPSQSEFDIIIFYTERNLNFKPNKVPDQATVDLASLRAGCRYSSRKRPSVVELGRRFYFMFPRDHGCAGTRVAHRNKDHDLPLTRGYYPFLLHRHISGGSAFQHKHDRAPKLGSATT